MTTKKTDGGLTKSGNILMDNTRLSVHH